MSQPKVVLVAINAKYIHSNLAVFSLKANAKEYEPWIELCEYTINHRQEQILTRLYEKKPDYIGFSCYIWNIEYVVGIARDLKKILPKTRIYVGGPEVSYRPEAFLQDNPFIDMVMVGEGEKTFYEYMKHVVDGTNELADIDGIVYRDGGNLHRTKPRQGLVMDDLVFPYRNLDGMDNRIIYYESIRGCPFACSYCLSSIEKTVRMKSLPLVYKELDFFLVQKVPQVKFVDRTFNCNHEHAYGIWSYIKEHDNGVTNFHFEIGGDLLKEEDFALLRTFRPGLVQFEIGVQSTNADTIEAIRRTMDLTQLQSNIETIHQGHNIHQHLDLIAGLPYEGYESFQKSFNEVYAMKPDQFQLGFLKVLEGSYMNEAKDEYEVIYSSRPPYEVYATKWLSYEDIRQLKQVEEMVEVYFNSFQFAATMTYLEAFFEDAFTMYREVGQYYKNQRLFDVKHSRIGRYEILWEFAMQKKHISSEELRETMTYDLYSRDYVKNPPSFVLPREEKKKAEIRSFFDGECEQPTVLSGYEGCVTKQLYNMIYMNQFSIDMRVLLETGIVKKTEPHYLLFDYKNRNPLNHSATVIKWEG